MKKFLQFLLNKEAGGKFETSTFLFKFSISYFELIFLPLVTALSVFMDNALIVVPGVILILVLQIILKNLLEEIK